MFNLDELNQLVRMAQVLRVRTGNLARTPAAARAIEKGSGAAREEVKRIEEAAELCREVQTKLERVRNYITDPDGAEEDAKGL